MFKVKVITQGRCKEAWLHAALSEYEKRLKNKMHVEWILTDSPKELEDIALKEPCLVALDLKGNYLSSVELSRKLFTQWGSRLSFAIGGPEGLSSQVLSKASFRLCLSPLTFTHQIVRLILIEQLYRCIEIEEGSSYHK